MSSIMRRLFRRGGRRPPLTLLFKSFDTYEVIMNQRRLFVAACIASVGILAAGCFLLIIWGGSPPAWFLTAELATVCAIALAYGFSSSLPSLRASLRSRPIQGAACIWLGVGSVFVPVEFVVAAILYRTRHTADLVGGM